MKRILLVIFSLLCITVVNAQWSEISFGSTSSFFSISAVDQAVWVAGEGGALFRSTNAGASWNNRGLQALTTDDLYNVFGITASTALVTGSGSAGSAIYRTSDGGTTWTSVFTQSGGFGDGIWMFDTLNGVFYGDPVGSKWSIWRTTDGGITWDSAGIVAPDPGQGAGWSNAIWGDDMRVYIGTSGSELLYSGDRGMTWTSMPVSEANTFSIAFQDTNTIWAGGAEIIMSTDAGATWNPITSPGDGSIVGLALMGDTVWMARGGTQTAPDTNIYRSTDQGLTWDTDFTTTHGGYSVHLSRVRNGSSIFLAEDNGWLARYFSTATAVNDPGYVPNQFNLGQNYPNPFNPSTRIDYQVKNSGFVSLKVFDALGREVSTLVNENKPAGSYTINFNALNLPSGIYIYRLTTDNFTDVKKMMLIK